MGLFNNYRLSVRVHKKVDDSWQPCYEELFLGIVAHCEKDAVSQCCPYEVLPYEDIDGCFAYKIEPYMFDVRVVKVDYQEPFITHVKYFPEAEVLRDIIELPMAYMLSVFEPLLKFTNFPEQKRLYDNLCKLYLILDDRVVNNLKTNKQIVGDQFSIADIHLLKHQAIKKWSTHTLKDFSFVDTVEFVHHIAIVAYPEELHDAINQSKTT